MAFAVVAAVVVGVSELVGACNSDETPCKADGDCSQGSFCRDGVCAIVDGGGGQGDARASACSAEGQGCTLPDECCSRTCTSSRCVLAAPPPTGTSSGGSSGTSGNRCANLYELCASTIDCCAGLSCANGTCR